MSIMVNPLPVLKHSGVKAKKKRIINKLVIGDR